MIDPTLNPSQRIRYEPVMASHAEVMFPILAEEKLYRFMGGEPPSEIADLEQWFGALESRTSADGSQDWLTWIMFPLDRGTALGYIQATIVEGEADIAWLVGVASQGNGYASEAATALVEWLLANRIERIRALIAPGHLSSQKVAAAAGLCATGGYRDGEEVWSN